MAIEPTLAELIAQEAEEQGLEHSAWVARILAPELRPEARGLEVAAAVKEFRRSNPNWLRVNGDGIPEVVAGEVHEGRRRSDPKPPKDAEGEPEPKPEPTIGDALRALLGPDDIQAARLRRMTTSPVAPGATTTTGGTDGDRS